jgi:hypothetical protein
MPNKTIVPARRKNNLRSRYYLLLIKRTPNNIVLEFWIRQTFGCSLAERAIRGQVKFLMDICIDPSSFSANTFYLFLAPVGKNEFVGFFTFHL